ncbi:hypothetical protein PB2503_08634 [Parvularcula bermudensis HTCC2503]|uniref:Uncharacterized protein n=1 Tax=Parvularcula bermudensis (strain ATCC BAA-594 / HTCC2503 / KCTC 12087) TaxID=314260 RepID=E0TBR1_PARBH|nr:hypothetical protein PB2503_08634 [Parvularcula bermudensis HTCC2503]
MATNPSTDVSARLAAVLPVSSATEAPDLDALGRYSIPQGRCGLVLWTLAAGKAVPVFQSISGGETTMKIEGTPVLLLQTGQAGEARVGIPAFQTFEAMTPSNGRVDIETRAAWGVGFPGGAYVERGTITLTGENGWKRVLPIAGIAGCRA